MIKVVVKKDKDSIKSIAINGHAMYDNFGKDIVCSAVSSITTTSINSILALDKDSLKYKVNSGNVLISDIKNDINTVKLLNVLINLLNELANDYPDNIEISEED